ncbi:uncharacterized protein [Asterias amurensis]|uniref:uncharacterized protein n=1 Tax=Asterias amurensis TaxID=7602 RepID=UPI003AB42AA8
MSQCQQNWTVEENMLLLDLYAQHRILLSRLKNSDKIELCEVCWASITERMNQDTAFDRSVVEVQCKWYHLIAKGKEDFLKWKAAHNDRRKRRVTVSAESIKAVEARWNIKFEDWKDSICDLPSRFFDSDLRKPTAATNAKELCPLNIRELICSISPETRNQVMHVAKREKLKKQRIAAKKNRSKILVDELNGLSTPAVVTPLPHRSTTSSRDGSATRTISTNSKGPANQPKKCIAAKKKISNKSLFSVNKLGGLSTSAVVTPLPHRSTTSSRDGSATRTISTNSKGPATQPKKCIAAKRKISNKSLVSVDKLGGLSTSAVVTPLPHRSTTSSRDGSATRTISTNSKGPATQPKKCIAAKRKISNKSLVSVDKLGGLSTSAVVTPLPTTTSQDGSATGTISTNSEGPANQPTPQTRTQKGSTLSIASNCTVSPSPNSTANIQVRNGVWSISPATSMYKNCLSTASIASTSAYDIQVQHDLETIAASASLNQISLESLHQPPVTTATIPPSSSPIIDPLLAPSSSHSQESSSPPPEEPARKKRRVSETVQSQREADLRMDILQLEKDKLWLETEKLRLEIDILREQKRQMNNSL